MFTTNTCDTTTTVEQNQVFTPAFTQTKADNSASKEESKPPKFIFLVGGLAGSVKTSHIVPLISHLTDELSLSVKYLDKDFIGRTMHVIVRKYIVK